MNRTQNKNRIGALIKVNLYILLMALAIPYTSAAQLSNSYIQNQTSAYQTANFWINGYGRVGGAEGSYKNYLKSFYEISNAFSGLVLESTGSINYGITGSFAPGFSFRWLAHNNGSINYAGVSDLIMKLSGYGRLYVKDRILINKESQTNSAYRLDVNGDIRANKVVVNTTGADYVFDSTYQVISLDSLNNYIRQHKHLPGIPSAAEMQSNGMDVGELYTKLLEKMEQMTIYMIGQGRKLDSLERVIHQLNNK